MTVTVIAAVIVVAAVTLFGWVMCRIAADSDHRADQLHNNDGGDT